MSDLFQDEIDRLNRTQNLVLSLIAREQKAADALEAAEAELARLEHQLQQAEEATTAAYKDAETAEARSADLQAKLAAIDALLWGYMRSTTLIMEGHPSEGRHDAYMAVWHILYPEEAQ